MQKNTIYSGEKILKTVIHRNFHPQTPSILNIKELNKLLLELKIGHYKQFEYFISRYRRYFNSRYTTSFKIVYLRDFLGFAWKHIAVLVRKKRSTCIKKYKKLKANPYLLFKKEFRTECL